MRNRFSTVFFLLMNVIVFGQKSSKTDDYLFTQFDLSIPIVQNTTITNANQTNGKNSRFAFNGISAKFGYGTQNEKWIGLSIHSGIDWCLKEKLVAIPVFGNLRLSAGLGTGSRITLQFGYGIGYGLSNNYNFSNYTKFSLGLETDNDVIIFGEISGYNFKNDNPNVGIISIGVAVRTF